MSKIIENLKDAISPAKPEPVRPLQAPQVLEQLNAAEAELARISKTHGDASLDAVLGVSGADARLATLEKEIATARNSVATLASAYKAAKDRDELMLRANRASLQKTQINAQKRHLDASDAAAVELSDAIGKAVDAYKRIVTHREKAAFAPINCGPLDYAGFLCTVEEIKTAIGAEIYRHDGGHPLEGNRRAFPGAAVGLEWQGNPKGIKPFADRVKAASQEILARVTGKVLG